MSLPESDSVCVVVVNRDAGVFLERCLAALADQSVLPARIIVFDNASTDGSITAARKVVEQDGRLAPRTSFHLAEENLGFAAANNRAIAACDTALVALLNPDAFPEPGWLAALLDAAGRHPTAAAFGSRQMLADAPELLDGVGDVYHVSGLSWRNGHGCPPTAADEQDGEIFSACAAAALYRRTAFAEVGGFDEDFFCYFEDVDLGFRLRLAGYRAVYVSQAVVLHAGGGSSPAGRTDFAVFHGHRNLVWCFVKNMPLPLLAALLPAHFSQTILTLVISVMRGDFWVIVTSTWQAVLGLPKCLRKRRVVQSRRRASAATVWRSLDKSLCRRRFRRRPLGTATRWPR